MNRFFDKNIEKKCIYCTKGTMSQDKLRIICKKNGIVSCDYSCSSFEYDPLMRKPAITSPKLPDYDPEEFKI